MLHLRRAIVVALAPCVLAACGDNSTEPRPPEFVGARIVAGKTGTDTIQTQFAQALVVELRDDQGRPVADHVVRFSTLPVESAGMFNAYTAYVTPVDRNDLRTFVADTTDAQGRARVLITLGTRAGPALVIVTDPDHGVADTATFTVQPGRAVAMQAAPADTAIYVGATFAVRSTVVDRFGNPRTDAVTHTLSGSAATLSGSTVSGVAIGVASVVSTSGTMADTINVSVPPQGVLAAFTPRGLATLNTDGSGFTTRLQGLSSGLSTAWSPTGTDIAFDQQYSGALQITNLSGTPRVVTAIGTWAIYPEYSRDGQWVYYSRYYWRLARVRPDGTGDTLVAMTSPYYDLAPSPSPDGTRLVYVRDSYPTQLWMLDLATSQSTDLRVAGHSPAWSPTGTVIAFLANNDGNRIKVVNPDGTGVRTVGVTSGGYTFGIDWSPDGQWIVARNVARNRLDLINATSGETIPLEFARGYVGPSWKP
jgi:hypothetical protein